MTDKRKGRQRKGDEEEKPTKEEYAVAKYLRFGLPPKEGKMHGMEVKCFFGNAAVDKLLESKWSASKNQKDPLFTNRVTCVSYLVRLLEKGLFHRAEREKRKKDKDKDKLKKKKKDGEKEDTLAVEDSSPRARKVKKEKKSKKDKEGEGAEEEESTKKEKEEDKDKKDEKKKKERRLKLVMPEEQFFEDSDEVYVWIYDPVNAKTFFIGLLMVLGAIALCMFPLWPAEVRIGVYYISLAAAGFVGFILFLVVLRLILFCIVWGLTLGRHHFWLLPNLTEDVGFFDSFRPLYKHDTVTSAEAQKADASGKDKKKKKGKEIELSGDGLQSENTGSNKDKSSDKEDSDEFEVIQKEDLDDHEAGDGQEEDDEAIDGNNLDEEEEDMNAEEEEEEDVIDEDENGDGDEDEEEEEAKDSEENETDPKDTKKTK